MEALLCERGGHPSLYAGKMGGPVKDNGSSRGFIFHDHCQVLQGAFAFFCVSALSLRKCIYLDLSSISWSSTESQWGISFQQLKEKFSCLKILRQTWESMGHYEGCCCSPFSEGPWLLVWGKVEGWVCISRFCRSSSFGFHQWRGAMKEK